MNRLQIDFTGRGARSPWARRILVVLALALSVDLAYSYRALRSTIAESEAKIAQGRSAPAPARLVAPEELAAVRETVERLAMPWDRLFDALEAAATEDVALLGIEPDPKAGTVQISGDSKNYLAALTYVLNLSRAEALSRVQLVRHEAKPNDAQAAVGFTVSAAWTGGKP
jgi:hypothetical protein